MTDLTIIILTKNEAIHIKRCLENIEALEPLQVFIVDCFSTDGTQGIARELGATVVEHEWPGLYAKQFNWALDNLPIKSKWVLRLDADEYLTPTTIAIIKDALPEAADNVTGFALELGRTFWGSPVSHGVGRMWLARLFRYGIGRCEDKAMDEHIIVARGRIEKLRGGKFVDDNLNSPNWWREKHRSYAIREATDAISLFSNPGRLKNPSETDKKKIKYYRLPPYFRAFAYFCVRYFLNCGFLDGLPGLRWHYWQALWYRCLVDKEIGVLKRELRNAQIANS